MLCFGRSRIPPLEFVQRGLTSPPIFLGARRAAFPYGSNITNRYLQGSNFAFGYWMTMSQVTGRKIADIAASQICTPDFIFCTSKEYRPLNCGTQTKCARTKLYAPSCSIPAGHFRDRSLDPELLLAIDLKRRAARARD